MSQASMEVAPAAAVVVAAFAAAWPTYAIMLKARTGRARSAIAYLLGFAAGLFATAVLATATGAVAAGASEVAVAGLLAAFIAPFVGMVHAKLSAPPRRRSGVPGVRGQPSGFRS
jgi:predicted branched-subunit amino acid permease